MKSQGDIRPGGIPATGAKVGMGVAFFLLLFGLVFLFVVLQEMSPSETGLMALVILFFLGFFGACLAIMVSCRRLIKAGKAAETDSLLEIRMESKGAAEGNRGDFDERLRKLEGLKQDGLITETEYRRKREALLKEDW
ncbi:MAG: SHOCT domain-containing protein [Desulfuromonadaceae bacterium]|nr:SHOCT domain-containing protein [Desulfuromonadaceae bacterium]